MARNRNTDFVSFLRSQGLRKRVARALSDLESSGRDARGDAEKLARRVVSDLRSAAEEIEKRLGLGSSPRSRGGARRSATSRARKAASSARKSAAGRKSSGRKTSRKSPARKTSARKSPGRKTTGRKSARKRS